MRSVWRLMSRAAAMHAQHDPAAGKEEPAAGAAQRRQQLLRRHGSRVGDHELGESPVAREICSAISVAASARSYSSWRLHQE
jgi:hypothetical protein